MPTVEELQAEIESLKAKNSEILDEKKKASKKADEEATARRQAESERDEATRAAEEAEARKQGDIKKLEEALAKKHAAEIKAKDDEIAALKKTTGELETARDALVLEGGLSEAVAAAGVAEAFRPAVTALLKSKGAKVEVKDGAFVAMIGDKPLSDAVKTFAESDEGKHFVTNGNTGGGAPGTIKGSPPASKGNPYHKDSLNKTEQGRLEKHNPTQANKYRQEVGLSPLKAA